MCSIPCELPGCKSVATCAAFLVFIQVDNHIPIKVFKLLMIVGDLVGGGGCCKMFSFRYTNTKGVCLFYGVFSINMGGGGGSGSDFIYSNHISESLYLTFDCKRIFICSHISGCAKYARWHTL